MSFRRRSRAARRLEIRSPRFDPSAIPARTILDAAESIGTLFHWWNQFVWDAGLLLKSQNILHVVKAGALVLQPEGSLDCPRGKSHTAGGFMSKLDPLPISGEHHSVIAHNITTPQGMHSNLGWGALTGNSDPAMRDVTVVGSCLLYTSPSPRDGLLSRMPSSA